MVARSRPLLFQSGGLKWVGPPIQTFVPLRLLMEDFLSIMGEQFSSSIYMQARQGAKRLKRGPRLSKISAERASSWPPPQQLESWWLATRKEALLYSVG
jgi:hypothetical protein